MQIPKIKMATGSQLNYIEILCNDIGCHNRTQALSLISNHIGREITFYGSLSKAEATSVIEELRRRKYGHDA